MEPLLLVMMDMLMDLQELEEMAEELEQEPGLQVEEADGFLLVLTELVHQEEQCHVWQATELLLPLEPEEDTPEVEELIWTVDGEPEAVEPEVLTTLELLRLM
jgi:hypothetical protein